MSFALAARLRSSFSPLCRTFQNSALLKPVPPPRGKHIIIFFLVHGLLKFNDFISGDISSPEDFLKTIGRGSEKKISFDTWDALWKTNGLALKKAGLAVRDRRCVRRVLKSIGSMIDDLHRYILWSMERYRQMDDPSGYAHEAQPKKKIRGSVFPPSSRVGSD